MRAERCDNSLMLATGVQTQYPNTPFLAISWEKLSPTDFGVRTNSILLSLPSCSPVWLVPYKCLAIPALSPPPPLSPCRCSRQEKQPLPCPAASLVDVPAGAGGLPFPLWITAMQRRVKEKCLEKMLPCFYSSSGGNSGSLLQMRVLFL